MLNRLAQHLAGLSATLRFGRLQPAAQRAWRHHPSGINVVGYVKAEMGVGEAARSTIRAARAAGIPVSVVDFRSASASRMEAELEAGIETGRRYRFNIFHVNADQMPLAARELGRAFFSDRYNIGVWNWELPELPAVFHGAWDFLDEVWAPSSFCAAAFRASSSKPVTHIPYCIVPPECEPVPRASLGLPEGAFLFLFMFDALSIPARKNPLGLLDAFEAAAKEISGKTALVLKVINGRHESDIMETLRKRAAANPSVILIEDYFSRGQLNALFGACDCYVSLHRSEGFGFTLAEAMGMGKPVIATGWSSNVDFMTPENSLLVESRPVKLERAYGPYPAGATWAEPDIAHAAACMARVANEPALREALGRRARADIARTLSPPAVGELVARRLREIG